MGITIDNTRIYKYKRQVFDKEFIGKGYWVKFTDEESGKSYCYPHDLYLAWIFQNTNAVKGTSSWDDSGRYSFPVISAAQRKVLSMFRVAS